MSLPCFKLNMRKAKCNDMGYKSLCLLLQAQNSPPSSPPSCQFGVALHSCPRPLYLQVCLPNVPFLLSDLTCYLAPSVRKPPSLDVGFLPPIPMRSCTNIYDTKCLPVTLMAVSLLDYIFLEC